MRRKAPPARAGHSQIPSEKHGFCENFAEIRGFFVRSSNYLSILYTRFERIASVFRNFFTDFVKSLRTKRQLQFAGETVDGRLMRDSPPIARRSHMGMSTIFALEA